MRLFEITDKTESRVGVYKAFLPRHWRIEVTQQHPQFAAITKDYFYGTFDYAVNEALKSWNEILEEQDEQTQQ